ncbi:IS21 family transposase, partial [Pseudomonas aeruginosa]|nr:IS21 family transposase [Pseudomonas aeruginosa]
MSVRKIARSLCIGHSSAGYYLCRFAASRLTWPCSLSDAELEQQLFPPAPAVASEKLPFPD